MWLIWLALINVQAFAADVDETSAETQEEAPAHVAPPPAPISPADLVPGGDTMFEVQVLTGDETLDVEDPQLATAFLVPPLPPIAEATAVPHVRTKHLFRRRNMVQPAESSEDAALLRAGPRGQLQPLSRSQHHWMKPSRVHLGPNPRAQTDYTAYSLEFGEVKVGISTLTVGVFPRVQLGTVPLLDALGIYNVHGKVNLLRIRGLDGSITAQYHVLPLGDFKGTYLGVGTHGSVILHRHLSLHGGASYTNMSMRGVPNLARVSPLITSLSGDLSQYNPPKEWFGDDAPTVRAEALTVKAAIDVRVNRRDSFLLQGQSMMRAAIVTDLPEDLAIAEALPPIAGLNEALSYQGSFSLKESYAVSISYQATWKQLSVRAGVGVSSVPYAWLLQSTELSYRFGGQTRRTEHRQRRTWRRNRRDVGPARPVAPRAPRALVEE